MIAKQFVILSAFVLTSSLCGRILTRGCKADDI
jgi:hypothetical protein